MLNMETFGAKLREHRKIRGMTQEEVAAKIGVSAQAVSKWESGECLPYCFNLKSLGEVYSISLDILLETEQTGIDAAASKVEQIADEYIWSRASRKPFSHIELGDDLWTLWKGIYFIEVGGHEKQREDYARGELRVCGKFGMKIWDDDGVACVVKNSLREKLDFGEREEKIISLLASHDGLRLTSLLEPVEPVSKEFLLENSGIGEARLNELLLALIESGVVEHSMRGFTDSEGYRLCAHCGVAAYMLLAAAHILAKKRYTVSEYFPN